MIEYQDILDTIYDDTERAVSRVYFEKYWLNASDFRATWLPTMEQIFRTGARCLPEMMFTPSFVLRVRNHGEIFLGEDDLRAFEKWTKSAGDSEFVVIENENVRYDGWLPVRFRYPPDISWQEINSGGIIGSEHVYNGFKDYFVFGDTGRWGLYVGGSFWIKMEDGWFEIGIFGVTEDLVGDYDSILGNNRSLSELGISESDLPEALRQNYFPDQ